MKIIKSAFFISLLLVITTSALALGKPQGVGTRPNIPLQLTGQPNGQTGKVRACQARENAIKTRSTRLMSLVTTMEEKFDAIAKRVEDYYTSKVLPSGKTVANYDSLVADIQTKKTAVQTALDKTKTDMDTFNCTSGDPKTQLTQFREDMQAVKKALKEYRTSIKNLIVAVHSVTGEEKSVKPTEKP